MVDEQMSSHIVKSRRTLVVLELVPMRALDVRAAQYAVNILRKRETRLVSRV
jgi:hypothetical protein